MPPGSHVSVLGSSDSADKNGKEVPSHGPPVITVMDGGFATQMTCHVDTPIDGDVLWSARSLATNPDAVVKTHLDFLRAGADLIITNTYQASVDGFMEHLKLSREDSYNLIKNAVTFAKKARDEFLEEQQPSNDESGGKTNVPLIVGSVGPYGASLHDASEYSGSYAADISREALRAFHRPRIQALIEGGVDMLALETIPCRIEAEMLVELIKEFPTVKAWLAFSCSQDGKSIAFGENFQEAARHCYDLNPNQLVAVGVNCLAPRLVESLFTGLNTSRPAHKAVPLIVYPNSGETYNVQQGWHDRGSCDPIETYVHKWLDLGVTYIGGCCRTYASDVSRIRNEVSNWLRQQSPTNAEQPAQQPSCIVANGSTAKH